MKRRLERHLQGVAGVREAKASTITSNLLVRFDPAIPLAQIIDRVAEAADDESAPSDGETGRSRGEPPWHAMSAAQVLADLGTSEADGLGEEEARMRLTGSGRNALAIVGARSGAAILIEQFQSLPVGLLAMAAGVSLLTGGAALEAVAIFTVIGLNAAVGYLTESRSERTIRGLAHIGKPMTRVIRDGRLIDVAVETVVPGDVLSVQRGALIPADARVLAAHDLTLSEALLTGESLPVTKTPSAVAAKRPLPERTSMLYRGTVVTGGSGTAVVVATGSHTEAGRIQRLIAAAGAPETPMQRQLGDLGRQLVGLSALICGGVFGIGLLRGFGFLQMFRSAVSLAVAAIPEGLPAVATTGLAIGIEAMRRRAVLVRRLDAVETLAAVQVICFDKTGTVTLNDMAVAEIACGEGAVRGDARMAWLLKVAVLCSETALEDDGQGGVRLIGSATENALVEQAVASGIDAGALRRRYPTLLIRQRTEAYRFMATVHAVADDGERTRPNLVAVKGSPGEVLERCRWKLGADGDRRPLGPEHRAAIEQENTRMADDALRVLGFAYREVGAHDATEPADLPIEDLTWAGLAGLADPVRPGMRELMADFHRAGIRTVLVTGDQSATARSVARQLGLSTGGEIEAVDADDLERMPSTHMAEAARRAHVFARVSPGQKLQIVRALQAAGLVVAMTGDGVNDGPALKAADIGVALGRNGTDAAREVADLVLEADDLTALIQALEHGRTTNANIRKTIRYLLSTNLSEILVVLAATAAGAGEMLSPMQLLWINLISDVLPALGLTCEPPRPGALDHGPLPAGEPIVRRQDFAPLAAEGALIGAAALAAGAVGALRYGGASGEARTMTFTSLVLAQMLQAFRCRTAPDDPPDSVMPSNHLLTGAVALSLVGQVAAFLVPGIRTLLGVAPLSLPDAAVTLACGALPYGLNAVRGHGRNVTSLRRTSPGRSRQ